MDRDDMRVGTGIMLILVYLAVIVAAAAGWVMNVLQLVRWESDITPVFVLKMIGTVVAPLGAVLGWVF